MKALFLPVAVISVKRDNLIHKEAFVSQKNFAEKNANECTSIIFENKEKVTYVLFNDVASEHVKTKAFINKHISRDNKVVMFDIKL
nr:hypothetical protein [Tanacetum cinerariifolium]